MDHTISLLGAGAKYIQISQRPAQWLSAGGLGCLRRTFRAGERQDSMTVADKFGDDGGTDQTRGTGNKDPHDSTPMLMSLSDI